ncbi:MAG TPA: hypothetical protein VJ768_07435, partial [Anaerolineales bacterium]|nr:hypothetical protein [Anaerolineales bacterium]
MEKQTIIWTALPHSSDGPVAEGTALRLSVHIAPRLWSDDPNAPVLPLNTFPDFLDWPSAIAQATFQVEFGGGLTVPALPVALNLRSDLWQGLFQAGTDVRPYLFEDMRGVPIETFPASEIYSILKGVYQRAAIDPAYGAGRDLPGVEILAADPDLKDIAREITPEEPFIPHDTDRGPVVLDKSGGGPGGGDSEGCLGCLTGCLAWPLALIRLLLEWAGLMPTSGGAAAVSGAGQASAGMTPPGGNPQAAFPVLPAVYNPPPPSTNTAFNQLNNYLQPYNLAPAPLPTAQEVEDLYDFHQMVASLGDYPLLLRMFGLVVDLEFTLPASLPPLSSTVKVLPSMNLQMATTHYSPRTHYDLGDSRFMASPRPVGPEISSGLLRLQDGAQFEVTQIDVAGGGIKLQNTATNMRGFDELNNRPANSPDDSGLPSLQTAGISVIRPEKGSSLAASFVKAVGLNSALSAVDGSPVKVVGMPGPPPAPTDELFAEDLARGYRIDVFDDKSNAWHSLCQRLGTYHFPDVPNGPETLTDLLDEGFVQMGATEPMPGTAVKVLRVHESIFTWAGWSLCAPRPGLTILTDHTPGEVQNTPVTQFQMETSFRARPGSLPRLRFGAEYRLRARVVDLAGNSAFTPEDAAFEQDVVE